MRELIVESAKISVDCEKNDPVDIRCGGPVYIGFDFFVPIDEAEELVKFVTEEVKKNNLPLLSVGWTKAGPVRKSQLWGKERIAQCIKKGY